ncbi:hypothetical protein BRADI_2g15965v3 [Brachypodium distachyon]|uniref:Uncharacterized protein n=1 Tax=Brachypodium distachyon TaxID=15368 RepID=A0A0Q3FZL2_BRADI|nr:hypothetical protein BRADI_2g15965v3 [Brachypodium distachyon]
MDFAGSTVDPGPVLPDFRRCAFASPSRGTKSVHQEESYVDALVKASLQLVRKGLPVEVQCHGVRMLLGAARHHHWAVASHVAKRLSYPVPSPLSSQIQHGRHEAGGSRA